MSAGEQTEQQVRRLVRELGSWRRDRRETAQRELAALGAEAVEPLLALAAEQGAAYGRAQRMTGWLSLVWFPYQILSAVERHTRLHGTFWTVVDSLFLAIGIGSIMPLVAQAVRGRRLRLSLLTLAEVDDRRIVAPFTDVLATERKPLKKLARAALKRALPRLTAADSALITAGRQRLLCAELAAASETYGGQFDAALAVAILHALEQVGDAEAMAAVGRVANSVAPNASKRRIRDAARRVLPVLKERAERAAAGRLLLRAAEGPNTTLLRPAASTDQAPHEQLLRAAASDGTGPAAGG